MRSTPVAVYGHLLSRPDLKRVVEADCNFTHCHPNVIDAVYLYSFAIGHLIKLGDNPERANLAFAETIEAAKEKCTKDVKDWLDLSFQFALNGGWDIRVLDPCQKIGFLKHGFVLAFYFLQLMPSLTYE